VAVVAVAAVVAVMKTDRDQAMVQGQLVVELRRAVTIR